MPTWIKASERLPDKDWVGVCKFKPIGSSLSPEVVFTNAAYVKHRANEYPSFEFEWLDESDPVEKDLESINTQMSKEEIAKKHIAAYYRNRGKNVSLDDILPMSRIYPMMEEYAQAKIKLLSQPPTGWISVEERLPPSFINVLVPMEAGLFIAHYDNLSGLWKDFNYEPINVTHWMPLPAPPETK